MIKQQYFSQWSALLVTIPLSAPRLIEGGGRSDNLELLESGIANKLTILYNCFPFPHFYIFYILWLWFNLIWQSSHSS